MFRRLFGMLRRKSPSEVVIEELVDELQDIGRTIEKRLSEEGISTTASFRKELYCFLCAVCYFWIMGQRSVLSDVEFVKQIQFSLLRSFRTDFSDAEEVLRMLNNRIDIYSSLVPSLSLSSDMASSGEIVSEFFNTVTNEDWQIVGREISILLLASTADILRYLNIIEDQIEAGMAKG